MLHEKACALILVGEYSSSGVTLRRYIYFSFFLRDKQATLCRETSSCHVAIFRLATSNHGSDSWRGVVFVVSVSPYRPNYIF